MHVKDEEASLAEMPRQEKPKSVLVPVGLSFKTLVSASGRVEVLETTFKAKIRRNDRVFLADSGVAISVELSCEEHQAIMEILTNAAKTQLKVMYDEL